jgi:hypothetical protein
MACGNLQIDTEKLETMKEQVFVTILDPYSGITYGISLKVMVPKHFRRIEWDAA